MQVPTVWQTVPYTRMDTVRTQERSVWMRPQTAGFPPPDMPRECPKWTKTLSRGMVRGDHHCAA